MRKRGHVPIRTCIGCRKKGVKEEMVWFKKGTQGMVPVNGKKNLGGRGFYLCPNPMCFKKAQKRKKMDWVFTVNQTVIPSEKKIHWIKDLT